MIWSTRRSSSYLPSLAAWNQLLLFSLFLYFLLYTFLFYASHEFPFPMVNRIVSTCLILSGNLRASSLLFSVLLTFFFGCTNFSLFYTASLACSLVSESIPLLTLGMARLTNLSHYLLHVFERCFLSFVTCFALLFCLLLFLILLILATNTFPSSVSLVNSRYYTLLTNTRICADAF